MRRIVIETIPTSAQRYHTVGDWQVIDDTLTIRVSEMTDDAEFCVAVHELLEAYLCLKRGVTAEMVDEDDKLPLVEPYEEHGEMPSVRYHQEHDFAWCVERLIAHELGLDWILYEEQLDAAHDEAPRSD